MKINRKTVLSTAAVLGVAALVAGGTIAYFTDHETKDNEFTIGSVDITLYESQLHRVNANVSSYFGGASTIAALAGDYNLCTSYISQGVSTINPYCTPNIAVGTDLTGVSAWQNGHVRAQNVATSVAGGGQVGVFTDAQIRADAIKVGDTSTETPVAATATNPGNYAGYVAAEYQNLVPGQQVRKFVYIQNDGTSDAYVRVKVTIPAKVVDSITVKAPHTPQETCAEDKNHNCLTGAANENKDGADFSNHKYVTQLMYGEGTNQVGYTTDANGNRIMTFIFTDALKSGEMTYWSPITTVRINDNADMSDFDADTLANGFGITVDADAIQAGGFADAAAAFAAYDARN